MNYTALSLSQTPPLSVPMPYFLAAPLFALLAALLLFFSGSDLLATRWSPTVLALTHLLTVGFLGTVMLGAMQQLVPVLIGVPLPAPRLVAPFVFLAWLTGAGSLIVGMATSTPMAVRAGGILLAVVIGLFALLVMRSLWLSSSRHATVRAMTLAVISLAITVSIPLYLITLFGGSLPLAHPMTGLHIGWGAVGWIFLLLVAVAYQVVPMFQITPEYPAAVRGWLALLMWEGLVVWSAQAIIPLMAYSAWLLALGMAVFALQTLRLLSQRRRKLADVTLDFWRLAMACLLLSVLAWGIGHLLPGTRWELMLGVLFLVGFAMSAVNGMLYKIVPFLVWLHLNNRLQQQGQWQGKVPNMKQVIPERSARWQFRLHLA
ncbi:MAG: hypothetical protein P8171_23040, partial [Candidatus Thiodiazotropha sp.]